MSPISSAVRLLSALLTLLLLSGCAASTLRPEADSAGANRRVAGRIVTVTMVDGTVHQADALRFEPDSTSWFRAYSADLVRVATPSIAEVSFRESGTVGRATMRGAVVGAVVGGVALGIMGYQNPSCVLYCGDPEDSTRLSSTADAALAGSMAGGVVGSGAGALLGLLSGPIVRVPVESPSP